MLSRLLRSWDWSGTVSISCVFISLLVGVPIDIESLVTEHVNVVSKCSNSEIHLHRDISQ